MKSAHLLLLLACIIIASCSNHEPPILNKNIGSDSIAIQDSTITDSVHVETVQTEEERIIDIKNWYKEITAIEKNQKSNQCETAIKITYDGFYEDDKFPFENDVHNCNYDDGLSVRKGNFFGHEWAEYTNFYFKNDVLFFVFIESGSEACFEEHRLYFDSDGELIKYVEKVNECNGDDPSISNDHTGDKSAKDMLRYVNEKLSEIESILVKGG